MSVSDVQLKGRIYIHWAKDSMSLSECSGDNQSYPGKPRLMHIDRCISAQGQRGQRRAEGLDRR